MTEKIIQEIIGKDRIISGHLIVCPNVNYLLRGEADMISVTKTGLLIEYEIKISRGDFKRDAKKGKAASFTDPLILQNTDYLERMPNQFYYVVPSNMIRIEEIPAWAGCYLITGDNKLWLWKKAPMIHKHKHDLLTILKKVATLYQQRHYLGGCLMTYKNKETIRQNRETFAKYAAPKCLDKKRKGDEPCRFAVNTCKECLQ